MVVKMQQQLRKKSNKTESSIREISDDDTPAESK